MKRDQVAAEREEGQHGREIAVADERLGGAAGLVAIEQRQ
jgi:hypothetical protein